MSAPIELTEEQIKIWRETLSLSIGPYALVMPVGRLQNLVNNLQEDLDNGAIK